MKTIDITWFESFKLNFFSYLFAFIQSIFFVSIILFLTYIFVLIIKNAFLRLERGKTPLGRVLSHYSFLKHLIIGIIYFVGISFAISVIPPLKGIAFSLLASSGILVAIIGFASQQVFSNVISGLFIEIFSPFKIGDRITIKNLTGYVEDITLRHTVIKTLENKRVIIPNSIISSEIVENASRPTSQTKAFIDIYLSYDSDLEKGLNLIKQILESNKQVYALKPQDIAVKVIKLAPDAVNIRAWFWAHSAADAFNVSCDLYKEIKIKFDQENISFAKYIQLASTE